MTASGMGAVTLAGTCAGRRARARAARLLRRHLPAVRRAGAARRARVEFVDFDDEAALRARAGPAAARVDRDAEQPAAAHHRHRGAGALAHAAGALVVVDNTFLSPVWQQPLALGADLVVHSTTKYLNGHSDVVGGAVIARDRGAARAAGWWANCLGITGAPFDSYLTLRGLRTLHARLALHGRNAPALADWLAQQPGVARVFYPGLPTIRGTSWRVRQQRASGPS